MREVKSKKRENLFEEYSPLEGELYLRQEYPDHIIAGIDEAGRGPLAGPVVAAVVVLASAEDIPGLEDSKKLTEAKREALFPIIQERALAWAIGEASPAEIDKINILQADFLAMRRALSALGWNDDLDIRSPVKSSTRLQWSRGQFPSSPMGVFCAVDGNLKISGVDPARQLPVVKGDAHVASIAAASILAKVHRDRAMLEWDLKFPHYGFAQHKGYPSEMHIDALREYGLSPIHRRSFKPKALDQMDLFSVEMILKHPTPKL